MQINFAGNDARAKIVKANLSVAQGLALTLGGGVPGLTVEGSGFSGGHGAMSISGAAAKTLVELKDVVLMSEGNVTISLSRCRSSA